jgi:regulator of Ty1 transposition protein 103
LQPLVQLQTALTRFEAAAQPLTNTADSEYLKLTDPNTPVPSPPVHAARLSSLLKNLATAEGAVKESIKTRMELITAVTNLLDSTRDKLEKEKDTEQLLESRRANIELKKKEVEDGIMRGLFSSATASGASSNAHSTHMSTHGSPEVESFTPPPPDLENFTPTGSPEPAFPADDNSHQQDFLESSTFAADNTQEREAQHGEPAPSSQLPSVLQTNIAALSDGANMLLNSLARPAPAPPAANGTPTDPRLKRRKMNHNSEMQEEMFAQGEGVGLDKDVAAMLGAE